MNLLNRMRRVNTLLQNSRGTSVHFMEMSDVLSEVIDTNVFILDKKGKILGHAIAQQIKSEQMKEILEERQVSEEYAHILENAHETISNIEVDSEYTVFPTENKELFKTGLTTIIPIIGGGERLGTLILSRTGKDFDNDDLILGEYSASIVGMEIMDERAELLEEEARSRTIVQIAISSLSYSELEAVDHIFEELDGKEGVLVASKIADRVGLTRSVIVNALRKLESAGVIESRSLGMKGTYIKILNDNFLGELEKATL